MTLDDWTAAVTLAVGLDYNDPRTRDEVLLLARDAAHGVARPAAPLTTFLLGVAVGRGADLVVAADQVRALLPGVDIADDGTETRAGSGDPGNSDGEQDKAVFVQG